MEIAKSDKNQTVFMQDVENGVSVDLGSILTFKVKDFDPHVKVEDTGNGSFKLIRDPERRNYTLNILIYDTQTKIRVVLPIETSFYHHTYIPVQYNYNKKIYKLLNYF